MFSFTNTVEELKGEIKKYESDIEIIKANMLFDETLCKFNSIESVRQKWKIRKELYENMIKKFELEIEYLNKCLEYKKYQ